MSFVVLETNNGLAFYDIIPSNEVDPPTILTQPVSHNLLEGGNITLSVSVTGTPPFSYQWFFNGNPISDATNSTLDKPNLTVEDSGEYSVTISNAAGSVESDTATLTVRSVASSNRLEPLFILSPGDRDYITTGNTERGMDINPSNGNVLLVSRSGGNISLNVLNGQTGAHLHAMSTPSDFIFGGIFTLSLVGVADDGAVYASNLTLDGTTTFYTLYRWDNDSPEAQPEVAWEGDPGFGSAARMGRHACRPGNRSKHPSINQFKRWRLRCFIHHCRRVDIRTNLFP